MKLFAITTRTAGALAPATLGFAGAATAMPAGPAPAAVTVRCMPAAATVRRWSIAPAGATPSPQVGNPQAVGRRRD